MLNLQEYRHRFDRLSDHLPWAALVAPGVVLNKDGSFSRVFALRGSDLESATEAELLSLSARANNVFKRLGSRWALHLEAERHEALSYPDSPFPDAISWLVDRERKARFEQAATHYESAYFLTLTYLPDEDQHDRIGRSLVSRPHQVKERDWRQALSNYVAETDRILDLLAGFMPIAQGLDDEELLSYFHSCISLKRHKVRVPETPMYLDALLPDTPIIGGLDPRIGDQHLRTLTILGFPNLTRPGLLDALNHEGFAYRWTSRFIALDKADASRELNKLRRQWFNKRKSITALLREVLYAQPAQLLDSDADNKAQDADMALQALGADHVAFGYLTVTITLWDVDQAKVEEKVKACERIINGLGFTLMRESANALEAWLGSLPANVYANVRQPLIHTLNLAHLLPLSSTWAGAKQSDHLSGPPLFYAECKGTTPFRFSTHVGDVGHMMIVGPTGAGKSVLLALMALQARRYPGAQIFLFDKGNSARAAVLGMGGLHQNISLGTSPSSEQNIAFQPLEHIDRDADKAWAASWIEGLLDREIWAVTPEMKETIWTALCSLAEVPRAERTITGLCLLLQSNLLRTALSPYALGGPYGSLLDAGHDDLNLSPLQCFETEGLMSHPDIAAPVLSYLFHRIEQSLDGRPTFLILDEAWLFLDHPLFKARIREWLKVLRKKNASVIFATQSLADIAQSSIAPAIIESCPQRIFLPNDRAHDPQIGKIYTQFGLNERQVELIAQAVPKREYYLQSARGNRLFELGLGPLAHAFCAASDPISQKLIDKILREQGPYGFGSNFLAARELAWALPLLEQHEALALSKEGASQ